jgi:hypothetical protein
MRRGARIGVLGLTSTCMLFAASVPAGAAKAIKGKLSEPGYTVIALTGEGRMTSAGAEPDFRLRTVAPKVTLHLRDPDGKYAGPVVVGDAGKRVIVGVKAGASLGRVIVREGYAEVARRLPKRSLDKSRTARARKGVPLGAGVFGRVRASTPRKSVPGDPDVDGLPNPFDIDDDGDLVLDDLDPSRKPRSARTPLSAPEVDLEWGYELTLGGTLVQTRNANAPGVTDEEIDAFLASRGDLVTGEGIQESATGNTVRGASWELDCGQPQSRTDPTLGGLVYCTTGGTGRVPPSPGAQGDRDTWPRFPDDFDTEDPPDGFGTLSEATSPLSHGATSTQIGTGDTLIGRVTFRGVETQVSTVLQYVPATPQALVSYDDGQGAVPVQYPVPGPDAEGVCPPQPGPPCNMWPGTQQNPLPVTARPNGVVVVTFTLWRPQRRPIGEGPRREACLDDPEPCEWIDIGGLNHAVGVGGSSPGAGGNGCPGAAYSESDPKLKIVLAPPPDPEDEDAVAGDGWLLDQANDRAANPANTFTYTVNLSECLASPQPPNDDFVPPDEWDIDETKQVFFGSGDGSGVEASGASQSVWFRRQAPPSP